MYHTFFVHPSIYWHLGDAMSLVWWKTNNNHSRMCKCFGGKIWLFPRAMWQGQMEVLILVLLEASALISTVLHQLALLPTMNKFPHFSISSPAFVVIVFLMTANLTGVRWNLEVVLNCISLMPKDTEMFLKNVYWPFVLFGELGVQWWPVYWLVFGLFFHSISYFLDINAFYEVYLTMVFCLFTLLIVHCAEGFEFHIIHFICQLLVLFLMLLGSYSESSCLYLCPAGIFLCFPLTVSVVQVLN